MARNKKEGLFQTEMVLRYCCLEMARRKGLNELPNTNRLKEFADEVLFGNFSLNLSRSKKKSLSYSQLGKLEQVFESEKLKQIFYYGPDQSNFWVAIKGLPDAWIVLEDMAYILGISASQVRELSENHLCVLLENAPISTFDVLAYGFLLLHESLIGKENVDFDESMISTIVDRLVVCGDALPYMSLFGLSTQKLYPLMGKGDWLYSKDKTLVKRTERYKLRVKDMYGMEKSFGLFLLSNLDRIGDVGNSIDEIERFDKELKNAELIVDIAN